MDGRRLIVFLLGAALLAGCGGSNESTSTTATAQTPKPVEGFKMAIVTDIGSLQDRSFNQLANEGRKAIGKKLGIQTRVYETHAESERIPNMLAASKAGYNLVFAVGFLNYNALNAVAPRFQKLQYAGIDQDYALFTKKPKNATGVIFAEQEAGYLVGYVAGLWETRHPVKGKMVVGGVGANKVPAIVRFLAGYRAGVHKANKKIKVLIDYANDPTFADQAKCKETTLNHIGKGSRVEFEAAGACGLGGLSAAKQKHIWGIGVDADQSFLGKHILTSATKHVDVAVFNTIKQFKANPSGFKAGFNVNYTLKNNGVGYGKLSSALSKADRTYITKKVNTIKTLIIQGKIKPPTS